MGFFERALTYNNGGKGFFIGDKVRYIFTTMYMCGGMDMYSELCFSMALLQIVMVSLLYKLADRKLSQSSCGRPK